MTEERWSILFEVPGNFVFWGSPHSQTFETYFL